LLIDLRDQPQQDLFAPVLDLGGLVEINRQTGQGHDRDRDRRDIQDQDPHQRQADAIFEKGRLGQGHPLPRGATQAPAPCAPTRSNKHSSSNRE
jgi:hypothetical protein